MRGWSLHKRSSTESVSYVVIATKLAKQTGERARSKVLDTNQDRHSLTLSRQGMQFTTVHAESGGDVIARDCRASQLQYLSRAYESAAGRVCVLAGDFNLRPGEDQVLLHESWRDVGRTDDWTWAHGVFQARYDRVYTHAGVAKRALGSRRSWGLIPDPRVWHQDAGPYRLNCSWALVGAAWWLPGTPWVFHPST